MSIAPHTEDTQPATLRALAWLFFRLGTTAFGGPAAHIAMMEDEVVRRRKWLTHDAFLDLIGAANLIPGPNSTELAIHIGHAKGGFRGLLVAGSAFILPAVAITMAVAWAYVEFGALPEATALLYGVKPVIIAVVVQALRGLAPKAVKDWKLGVLGALCAAGVIAGLNEVLVLLVAGAIGMAMVRHRTEQPARSFLPLFMIPGLTSAAAATPFSLGGLFLTFLKIGSVLFGSGYVLLAYLRADLVERLHWMTEAQLLDAVAAGQVTPGPVFTTATFVGYVLGGPMGAAAATVGIFLPAFFFVAISGPLVPRLRANENARGFLDGVNVASLALMAVVSVQLARAALVDGVTVALAVASAVLLLRWKVNSVILVALGAGTGVALSLLGVR